MSNILKVQDLKYNNRTIGIVGIDMSSGEIRQYSFLDMHCTYESPDLESIDVKSMPDCLLKSWINAPSTKRRDAVEMLPDDIKYYISNAVLKHKNFNRENGLPCLQMNFHMKSLEMYFSENDTDEELVKVYGDYCCPANSIVIVLNRLHNSLSEEQKRLEKNVILHEIGHLKVAGIKMDTKKNLLYCSLGFFNFIYDLNPIFVVGEDVIYSASRRCETEKLGLSLEEVFNEQECLWIDSRYRIMYPKYGSILHGLSEGTLLKARYNHDIDEYFKVMTSIIPDEKMALELLRCMDNSIQNKSSEDKGRAFTLLKKYEDSKIANNHH